MRAKIVFVLNLLLLGSVHPVPTTTQPTSLANNATEIELCPCSTNSTPTPTPQLPHTLMRGMTCVCHASSAMQAPTSRDDYRYSPGIGAHKLHTRGATWNDARKMCNEEGGHLAIVNTISEAHVLMEMLAKSGPLKGVSYTDMAYVGIHDLYKEGEWVTILGDSLFKSGYTVWSDKWGGQPDNGGGNQNCGVMLKDGGLDDVNCNVPFAFFCELPTAYTMH